MKFEVGKKEQEEHPVIFIAVSSRLAGLTCTEDVTGGSRGTGGGLGTWALKYWSMDLENDWSRRGGGE